MKYLLIGTRKGLIVFKKENGYWKTLRTDFLGIPISIAYADNKGSWWACQDHGHWGVKLHRSMDLGDTWEEVKPPVYPEGEEVKENVPAYLRYIWSVARGKNCLLLGTDPGGLFESKDNGDSFVLNKGLWEHDSRKQWFGGGRDQPGIHSICIDPRNGDHMYVGISCAGVFETLDGGESWTPRNKGLKADFLPDPDSEIGQDPHLLVMSPSNPDVLWQQNHCGIFRSIDGGKNWADVSEKNGPANFGFTIEVHNENENMAWVIPGVSDGVRVAVDQKLQVCRTSDGGKTWKNFTNGLPQEDCYDIVYRHCLDFDGEDLVFGTTTGNLFVSSDLGENWSCISNYLPLVYSVQLI